MLSRGAGVRIFLGALFFCAAGIVGAPADQTCHLYRIATFDMTPDRSGGPNIQMVVSGKTVNFLLDTGGLFSMLTAKTVAELGLPVRSIINSQITMYGGRQLKYYVTAHDITLGRITGPQMQFLVVPDDALPSQTGGTLAPDLLRLYDADFDFGGAKFSLFAPDHCPGKVVYWRHNGEYAIIDFDIDLNGHIKFPVELDGETVKVEMDTGSSMSMMSLDWAEKNFDFDPRDATTNPNAQISGESYERAFKTLSFGGVTVNNPKILLVPDSKSHMRAAIIGMTILRKLHIYIAYGEHKLYVSAASDSPASASTPAAPMPGEPARTSPTQP